MATVHENIPLPGYDVLVAGVLPFVNDFETLENMISVHPDVREMLEGFYSMADHPSIRFAGPQTDINVHDSRSIDFFLRHNDRAYLCSSDFKYVCLFCDASSVFLDLSSNYCFVRIASYYRSRCIIL